jgi:nicotinate-nucleotide pyrophosphorylase (carboxylating)
MFIPKVLLEEKLKSLLMEDVGLGDVTTAVAVPEGLKADAVVVAKEACVVAGIEEVTVLAEVLGLKVKSVVRDGDEVDAGQTILEFSGDARNILVAERTVLNLLSRMCGIATATRKLVKALKQARVGTKIAATRKTAPGLLYFDKKAVAIGGGDPHRLHLDDMVLIKDNHIAIAGSLEEAINRVKQKVSFSKKIEVEVTSVDDAVYAAEAGADIVMLDNMTPEKIKDAVEAIRRSGLNRAVLIEASGQITEENFLEYASTQVVDVLSIGALTHDVKCVDISLEIKK